MSDDGDNIIHFNPWRDFNDAPVAIDDDPFDLEPDPAQIGVFLDVVFGYCEGWIPFRGFIDKGQGFAGRPHNIWVEADDKVADKAVNFAGWAAREGAAFYVVPGTVPSSAVPSRPTSGRCRRWWSISTPATSPPSSITCLRISASRR